MQPLQIETEVADRVSLGTVAHRAFGLKRTVVVLLLIFCSYSAFAHASTLIRPPLLVRLTGTLLPVEGEGERGLYPPLNVLVNGKRWIFSLAKVENLAGIGQGWMILQHIFPFQLRLSGPEHLLNNFHKPVVVAKLLAIEGRLYIGSRLLVITAVQEDK